MRSTISTRRFFARTSSVRLVATGATMRAAIRAVRATGPRAIAIATPVASVEAVEELRPEVDDVVCLEVHRDLGAIGFYYADFAQVSDREGIEALERAGHIKTVLLDKMGTITLGKTGLTDIVVESGWTEDEALAAAASLEALSEHPIARAVVRAAQ